MDNINLSNLSLEEITNLCKEANSRKNELEKELLDMYIGKCYVEEHSYGYDYTKILSVENNSKKLFKSFCTYFLYDEDENEIVQIETSENDILLNELDSNSEIPAEDFDILLKENLDKFRNYILKNMKSMKSPNKWNK